MHAVMKKQGKSTEIEKKYLLCIDIETKQTGVIRTGIFCQMWKKQRAQRGCIYIDNFLEKSSRCIKKGRGSPVPISICCHALVYFLPHCGASFSLPPKHLWLNSSIIGKELTTPKSRSTMISNRLNNKARSIFTRKERYCVFDKEKKAKWLNGYSIAFRGGGQKKRNPPIIN